ncbi:hypothetical protein M9435_001792 [Picochlorum sp. BPE23]|nr:hypothetical protein M9435_001792 [Picochlorum sp. BPE23]
MVGQTRLLCMSDMSLHHHIRRTCHGALLAPSWRHNIYQNAIKQRRAVADSSDGSQGGLNNDCHMFSVSELDLKDNGQKLRLDAFLSNKLSHQETSRARLQATIKQGRVLVNGTVLTKASYAVKVGDTVECSVLPPPPLRADPEDIDLDIVYEDDDVIVINKEADMVMHPAPGHSSGTMVNALLHHCGLESVEFDGNDAGSLIADRDEDQGGVSLMPASSSGSQNVIRPGIVHRLDKGTTGLVVIAKTDVAHASLSAQFKDRTVNRTYLSLTLGVPTPSKARIRTNIGRDFRDRKKMAAFEYACTRGKSAASNYTVLETLASGTAALVSWKLETGRTHQIRVHAKHIRHPLFGDDTYGGSVSSATRVIGQGKSARIAQVHKLVQVLNNRPALHAQTLGFEHPTRPNKERLVFSCDPPEDFALVLQSLRHEL